MGVAAIIVASLSGLVLGLVSLLLGSSSWTALTIWWSAASIASLTLVAILAARKRDDTDFEQAVIDEIDHLSFQICQKKIGGAANLVGTKSRSIK